jgi:hypothetical protein
MLASRSRDQKKTRPRRDTVWKRRELMFSFAELLEGTGCRGGVMSECLGGSTDCIQQREEIQDEGRLRRQQS